MNALQDCARTPSVMAINKNQQIANMITTARVACAGITNALNRFRIQTKLLMTRIINRIKPTIQIFRNKMNINNRKTISKKIKI